MQHHSSENPQDKQVQKNQQHLFREACYNAHTFFLATRGKFTLSEFLIVGYLRTLPRKDPGTYTSSPYTCSVTNKELSEQLNITTERVRCLMKKLERNKYITIDKSNGERLITVFV